MSALNLQRRAHFASPFLGVVVYVLLATSVSAQKPGVQLDADLQKAGAAHALAQAAVTDALYNQLVKQMLAPYADKLDPSGIAVTSVKVLAERDPKLFSEALLAMSKRLLPREKVVGVLEGILSSKLTYAEMKQSLAFVDSNAGKKFVQVVLDGQTWDQAVAALPSPPEEDVKQIALQELRTRFPHDDIHW